MKQTHKQKSLKSRTWKRFCVHIAGLGMAVVLGNSGLYLPSAQADVFTFDFTLGTIEGEGGSKIPTNSFTNEEKNLMNLTLNYINQAVKSNSKYGNRTVRILQHGHSDLAEPKHNGFSSIYNVAHANYDSTPYVCFNFEDYKFPIKEVTQFRNIPDNIKIQSLQAITTHELGHTLGMTFTRTDNLYFDDSILSVDNSWSRQIIGILPEGNIDTRSLDGLHTSWDPDGNDTLNKRLSEGVRYYFTGGTSTEVYGDKWVTNSTALLPIEDGLGKANYLFVSGTSMTHCYTRFGVLNGITYSDARPFYNEVELAVLQDVGNEVNIRQQFGRSLYQENTTIVSATNTQSFGKWNEKTQSYENAPNTADFGIGLHFVGDRYNITQAANLLADGKNGTGIRLEGTENSVTINPGVLVTANGENGIGVLATHGNETYVNNRGTIEATGLNGTAVYLNSGVWKTDEYNYTIEGGLKTFDNTGIINAGTNNNAIFLNGQNTEDTLTINIMGGSIIGNITSQNNEDDDTDYAKLTFGKLADKDGSSTETGNTGFNMTYTGEISGEEGIKLEHWGGNLSLTGSVIKVKELWVGNDINSTSATMNAIGTIIVNGTVNLGDTTNYKTIVYDGKTTGSLEGINIFNYQNSTIQNVSNIKSDYKNGYLSNMGTMVNVNSIQIAEFQNTGEITVGESGTISTMSIEGFVQNDYGTLNVDTNLAAKPASGTSADLITVSELKTKDSTVEGKMVINSGLVNVNEINAAGSYFRAGINHNIIETQDGVTVNGELKADETGYDIPLFKPVIGHDDKNVWVGLQRDFLYGPAGKTFNQTEFGYYIDEIGKTPNPTGDLFTVLIKLDSLNLSKKTGIVSDRALHALDEMSGAVYGTVTSLANQHSSMINNSLAKHLRDWSPCDVMENGWNVWAEAYGMGGSASHDGNAHGYNYSVAGTLVGIDHNIAYDGHLGGYFAVGKTNADVKGLSESADSTDIFAGAYLNLKDTGIWYTTFFAGFGYSDYDVERHFTFIPRNNKSEFDSWQVNIYAERGVNLALSEFWFLQPFGGIQFIGSSRKEIHEKGADLLDLNIEGESTNSFRSMLGMKLATSKCAGRKLNGELSAAWMHEYADAVSQVAAQMSNPGGAYFESSPTYVIHGHNDGRNWLVAGAGLNYTFTQNVKIFGGYDCMANGIGAMHMGNLGLELHW